MGRVTSINEAQQDGVDKPHPGKGNSRYIAGLDGLRTLAVFAVIAYHLNLGFAPGGLLGVGVFFVLSGYLITDLLMVEWERNGRINLKDFWLRRARRLLPALFLMLVGVTLWITLFDRTQLLQLRGDLTAALLYMSNWWFIFHHVSYFASFGPPSPLGHLWSLAVEEQFYLLWPLILWLGLRFGPRRGWLGVVTLVGATASALAMALIYLPGTDPSRVYYGTDTRAFALLIGGALALVFPRRSASDKSASLGTRITLDLFGAAGLITVVYMMVSTNQYEDFLYRGGMVAQSIATAVVIAAMTFPASYLNRVMGLKPLRWLGVRSYGIYLWHFPVIILSTPAVDTNGVDVPRAVFQVVASILLAALSWRFIEKRIRYGAVTQMGRAIRTRTWFRGHRVASLCVLLVMAVPTIGLALPTHAAVTSFASNEDSVTPEIPSPPAQKDTLGIHNLSVTSHTKPTQPLRPTSVTKTSQPTKATQPRHVQAGRGITAIGDSVMIDIAPYLRQRLPGIVIDGQVGRQMYQLPAVVADLKSKHKLGSRIIIETGTNGPFTKEQLVALLRSLGHVDQIILVNTRVPRPWESVVNSTLMEVAAAVPHTTLINWYAASTGKNSFFYPDGVHLNPQGSAFYASLVAKAVQH